MKTVRGLWIATVLVPCLAAQQQPPQGGSKGNPAVAGPPAPEHSHVHTPPMPPGKGGNDWFDKTRQDLGTFFEKEIAVGKFGFSNPRDVVHKLSNLQPNCACAKAVIRLGKRKYEISADRILYRVTKDNSGGELREKVGHINVAPEEKGEIEVHMTMLGIKGPKDANLIFRIDDEKLPVGNLSWRAVGATYFVVEPPDIHLNEMSWKDKREFEFRISSPMKKDFNILSHDDLPKAMKVSYRKEIKDGKAFWHVKGTYGPGANERDQGGLLKFKTDVDNKIAEARVTAFLKGPLTMKPGGFVSLGLVRKDEGKQVEVTLTPTDVFDLQVEKLEIGKLRGVKDDQRKFVHFTHHKDGQEVKVVIKVDGGMNPTYMNGILKIHLNHPASKLKELMFNGIVR